MIKRLAYMFIATLFVAGCARQKKGQTDAPLFTPLEQAVLYEVNIRQYTPEGTFNAFAAHLPRLKKLGVDVLWLMPVYPISEEKRKGSLGSYYAVRDYRKVNPEFGNLKDLQSLVQKAHRLGMRVILDWVANHTGWDNPWIEQHPDWYTQVDGKIVSPVADWEDVADLNYDNREMREEMIGSMAYWVKEAGVDGFRCDMAAMVPTDFWEEARIRLDSLKPVFMLAEAWEPELTRQAFDACYAWDLHHLMNDIAQGKKPSGELNAYFARVDTLYPSKAMLMNFLDNHDENSWNGTIRSRIGEAQKAFAVLTWTVPGIPLMYTGQEAGLDHSLRFFDKDEVDWKRDTAWTAFYGWLNRLKHTHPALKVGGKAGFRLLPLENGEGGCAYERTNGKEQLVVVLNLSATEQKLTLAAPLEGKYRNYETDEVCQRIDKLLLPAWDYRIFTHE